MLQLFALDAEILFLLPTCFQICEAATPPCLCSNASSEGNPLMRSIIFNMYESPFFRFISFFSRRRQTSRREQRHRPWTWVPLPHSNHTQTHSLSLSVCASLPLFPPLAPHPYPHPNPTPSSYVCKRSHGNCRTVCLATGFILSLEKKRGAERGGCVCVEGRGGVYGCMDVGEDDRGTAACCSGSIKADSLSPLTTPAATASTMFPFSFTAGFLHFTLSLFY